MKTTVLSLLVAVGLIASASAAVFTGDLTNGLVGYWNFHGNADDVIGGNNATLSGAELCPDRFGNENSALMITSNGGGGNSLFDINVLGNADRTLSYWLKFSSAAPHNHDNIYVGYGEDSFTHRFGLFQEPSADIWFNGSYVDITTPYSDTPSYDQWRMITISYQNTIYNSTIYENGVAQSRSSYNASSSTLNTTPSSLGFYGPVGGYIDDITFYNTALTSTQVSQLYALQSVPEPSTYALFGLGIGGILLAVRRKRLC